MKDLESGRIIGKGIFDYVNQNGKSIPRKMIITLTVKDYKYKYDIELEIVREYEVEMKASCFNCGKTIATVKYLNGSLQISNIVGGRGTYFYDNDNVNWVEKGNYKKWKAAVEAELPELKDKIEKETFNLEIQNQELDKLLLKNLIEALKKEMIKASDRF